MFENWWRDEGRMIDPDTDDVPWFDKREALANIAYEAGWKAGMAAGGNYIADDAVEPTIFTFANGRTVKSVGGRLVLVQP